MIYAIYGDEGPKDSKKGDYSKAWMRLIIVNTIEESRRIMQSLEYGSVPGRKNPRFVAIFSDNPDDYQYGCEPVINWAKPHKGGNVGR